VLDIEQANDVRVGEALVNRELALDHARRGRSVLRHAHWPEKLQSHLPWQVVGCVGLCHPQKHLRKRACPKEMH
jgi:hypothetical protein